MKNFRDQLNQKRGFTLIETIVFLGAFGVLSILTTVTLFVVLGSMTKARITREVRRNGDNAMQIIERQLRVAKSISTAPGTCGSSAGSVSVLQYIDQYNSPLSFSCVSVGGVNGIASVSAQTNLLTDTTRVGIQNCAVFTCDQSTVPKWVRIDFVLSSLAVGRVTEMFQSRWQTQVGVRYQ